MLFQVPVNHRLAIDQHHGIGDAVVIFIPHNSVIETGIAGTGSMGIGQGSKIKQMGAELPRVGAFGKRTGPVTQCDTDKTFQ